AGAVSRRRNRDARRDLRPRGFGRHLPTDGLDPDPLTVSGPAIDPLLTFDCLWCGRSWTVRAPEDRAGFARLCPDCLGKAGDNEFLRFRLRSALEARAAATSPAPAAPAASASPATSRET